MLTLRNASLAIAVVLAGCAQIEVRDANAPPGSTVTTEDHNKNMMLGWIPRVAPSNRPGIDHWTRIRVIAPEGASECRSGSMFSRGGPEAKGRPDANRAIMLTSRQGDRTAHFICDTPGGAVRRSVNASVYTQVLGNGRRTVKYHVLPPLVHIDPGDPEAEVRWAALGAELCPVVSERVLGFVCKPGMLEKFKAEDLSKAS